jgi:hypothetical protein
MKSRMRVPHVWTSSHGIRSDPQNGFLRLQLFLIQSQKNLSKAAYAASSTGVE